MKDENKSKQQLIQELTALRQQVAELKALQSERSPTKQASGQVEEALAQEHNLPAETYGLLRTLIDNLPDSIYVKDTESRIVIGNVALARHAGVASPGELVGKTSFDFSRPELAAKYYADDQTIIRTGQPLVDRQEPAIDPMTGRRRWVSTTKVPLRDSRGEIVGLVGMSRDITQRKLAQIALQESEARFRVLAETTAAAIVIYRDGELLYMNPAVEAMSDYTREELSVMDLWDTVHPDYRERIREWSLAHQRKGQAPSRYEAKTLSKDGQERWIDVTASLIEFEGKPAVLGTAFDITERKRAELERERLLAAEREQRLQAEILREVILALTSQMSYGAVLDEILRQAQRVVPCSATNIALLKGDALHTVRWQGYQAFGCDKLMANLTQSLSDFPVDAEVVRSRRSLVAPDTHQEPRWVHVEGTTWIRSYLTVPICSRDGVLGLLRLDSDVPGKFSAKDAECLQPLANAAAIALENARLCDQMRQEIAERARTEEELRRSQARCKALLDATPDLMFRMTREGLLLDFVCNKDEASDLYATHADLLGKNVNSVMPPEFVETILYHIGQALDSGVAQIFEYQLPMPHGIQDYETRMVASGENEAVAIVRNVTERKQAEQQMIQAERLAALGRLAAALAHEMNNPLQVVQSHLDLLLDFPLEPGEDKRCLDVVRHEVKRLNDVTHRVLNFVHPGSVPCEPVAVAKLVQQVLTLAAKELQRNDIEVTTDWQDVPRVLVEPDQLTQIFLNLVINAIEAMPDNGQLHAAVYSEGDQVAISFTDSGPTIPQEILPHIFEPFFTTKPDGSGLGLWVSHGLVQQHGGSLTVENLENGQGVTCTVKLPSAPPRWT